MHRSGTSALTRVLNIVGVALPDNLIPPAEDNIKGFWESENIKQIHDEILESAGSYWHDISEFPPTWFASPLAQKYEDKIIELLKRDLWNLPLYTIKDPRICRLIPLWIRVLDRLSTEARFIIPIRHPFEVAASLKTRHGFDTNKSLLLWLWHFLDAERDTRNYRRTFVTYEQLLTSWQTLVSRLETELGIVFPRRSHLATIEIEQFLSPNLRHHNLSCEDLAARPDIASWVSETFAWGMAACQGERVSPDELDNIRQILQEADKIYGPIITHHELLQKQQRGKEQEYAVVLDKYHQAESTIGQLQSQINNSQAQCEQTTTELIQVRNDHDRAKEELTNLHGQLGQTRNELIQTAAQWEETKQELINANAQREQTQAQLDTVHLDWEQDRLRLSHTQAQLQETQAQLQETQTQLQETQTQLQETQTQLQETQTQLQETQTQLQETQVELTQARTEVENTRTKLAESLTRREKIELELARSQAQIRDYIGKVARVEAEREQVESQLTVARQQLNQSYQEWQQTQNQLEQAQHGWERAHTIIEAMESSKFWKLRGKWFKIKTLLGLEVK
ncbi:MAG: hypothetical protein Cpurp_14605 [Chlorogloea purpurea SAG 13.99]|nr:hypothetical protein [Chlorogloea purpurea SAG 13.99]